MGIIYLCDEDNVNLMGVNPPILYLDGVIVIYAIWFSYYTFFISTLHIDKRNEALLTQQ